MKRSRFEISDVPLSMGLLCKIVDFQGYCFDSTVRRKLNDEKKIVTVTVDDAGAQGLI